MGRRPKTQEELDSFKSKILDMTLSLIAENGYKGFSIRKLGPKLGIAPKTIYNYFQNKDEIYLHVLTRGFDLLYENFCQSIKDIEDPFDKLEAIARAHVKFGFEKPNYYDLMFTRHVPKYNDFRGTDLEPLALKELQSALNAFNLLVEIIKELSQKYGHIKENEVETLAIHLFSATHGVVALKNNTLLYYVHKDPDAIINSLLEQILKPVRPVSL